MAQILLASASPRRAELLQQLGVGFDVAPANIDETSKVHETPLAYVRRMALTKAEVGVAAGSSAVLAADTIVVAPHSGSALGSSGYRKNRHGRILGKPTGVAQASQMLCALSDQTHQVYTAVAVRMGVQQAFACVCTHVSFRSVSSQEARAYWNTGEPVDKAGGYGIQGVGGNFVKKIDGSYTNVVGLPLYETACLLRALRLLD